MSERRTQPERKASAMARLEEAAIEALVACGAEGASTTEICARAGLSQGALFQHYDTKSALLVAAVSRLYERLHREFLASLASAPPGEASDRVLHVLRLTWAAFANPAAVATLGLYHRCRTDRELHAALAPMLDAHAAKLAEEGVRVLGPWIRQTPQTPVVLAATMAALQGAAPGAVIEGREPPLLEPTLRWFAAQLTGDPR